MTCVTRTINGNSSNITRYNRKQFPQRVRPCELQKLVNSVKLRKACAIDNIPNECLRQLARRPLVYLTHLIIHCLRLSHFPTPWKEAKIITLPKPGKDSNFPHSWQTISLLSTTGKPFERIILKFVKRHIDEKKPAKLLVSLDSVLVTARLYNVWD
jgi:hypothetical protein